ncbi:TNF receptor-associated factor 4 [Chironomus tepperi]|uniref:TNF receptor-associated factor 4 n=1 Tax=Chironomus tepperi TaxID=113505 RepID=UPI00391EF4D3
MVRSLSQWTKTLSFPNRHSKECNVNVHPIQAPPTPARNKTNNSSPSSSPPNSPSNVPITEISQIIYPDPDSEKVIMGSLVFCIHHKEGCKWSDELRKLKAHLNTCKFDAIPCPNLCNGQIPRVMMSDHLAFTCTLRRAVCEFCNVEFSGQGLEEHQGFCTQEPIYCESKCGTRVLRGRMSIHRSKDCLKRMKRCQHCQREFSADTLSLHASTCSRTPVSCPQRCEASPLPRGELDAHLRDECKALSVPCTFKEAGCRFKGPRNMLETHLEANTAAHLSLMVQLSTKQNQQIASLKNAVSKLSTNYTGTLLWKITDWSTKMKEAKNKEGLELVSPPFYTSQYGYKLQASVFLNGNGPGEGTHLSVYIKVLPGEYDALLKWPFSHSVTFTLFEQCPIGSGAQGGVAESFVPDPSWENFQRPSAEPDSLGFGFPRFISHELLSRRPFVRDDTVFLRIKADPSKVVAV